MTEWVLMRLGNDVQEKEETLLSFPDGLYHPRTHVRQTHSCKKCPLVHGYSAEVSDRSGVRTHGEDACKSTLMQSQAAAVKLVL